MPSKMITRRETKPVEQRVNELCDLWAWVLDTRKKLQECVRFYELFDGYSRQLPEDQTQKAAVLGQLKWMGPPEKVALRLRLARKSLKDFDADLLPHCKRADPPYSLRGKYSGPVAPEESLGLPDRFSQRDKALAHAVAIITREITQMFNGITRENAEERGVDILRRVVPEIIQVQRLASRQGQKGTCSPGIGSVQQREHVQNEGKDGGVSPILTEAERKLLIKAAATFNDDFWSDDVQAILKNPRARRGGKKKAAILLVSKVTGWGTRTIQEACSNYRQWPER